MNLSVGAAVTSSLETNVTERLTWLEAVFHSINPRVSIPSSIHHTSVSDCLIHFQDPEIRDVAGRILEVLSQRLEGEYMRIAEDEPQNPALRKIPSLAKNARELRSYAL